MAEMKTEDGKKERYFLYYDGESVSGKVSSHVSSLTVSSTYVPSFHLIFYKIHMYTYTICINSFILFVFKYKK